MSLTKTDYALIVAAIGLLVIVGLRAAGLVGGADAGGTSSSGGGAA